MLKEGAYVEENSEGSIERQGRLPKESLKRILESRVVPTDWGKHSILFRVDPEDLSPEERSQIALESEDNPEGLLSIKALKIFSLEKAEKEFEALTEARKIILKKAESSSAPLARIPRAVGFDEIKISKATQDLLNANGAEIVDGKVGVITMDWIEGKDLAAVLHEELLKRLPEGEDPYEKRLWDTPDFSDLLHALERKGFVLPEEILTQLKNTVEALHKDKLYHNDIHLRNLILKDARLENPQLYLIDFENSTHERKTIDQAEGEFYLSDENILITLEPLIKTPETKEKAREEHMMKEWNERVSIIEKQPKAQKQYVSLKEALDADNVTMLDGQLAASSGSDGDVENFLGNLLRLSREKETYREQIKIFLGVRGSDKKTKMRGFVLNRIHALQRAIEI